MKLERVKDAEMSFGQGFGARIDLVNGEPKRFELIKVDDDGAINVLAVITERYSGLEISAPAKPKPIKRWRAERTTGGMTLALLGDFASEYEARQFVGKYLDGEFEFAEIERLPMEGEEK